MQTEKLEVRIVVLGGGPAGYVAAIRAAQLGTDVVVVEKAALGGVCMNVGCIPTKAMLKTSSAISAMKRSKEFGVHGYVDQINWAEAAERKNRIVKNLNTGLDQLLRSRKIRVLKGNGTVKSPHEIMVETNDGNISVYCENIILATGSTPLKPSIPGIELDGVLTSTEALALTDLPDSITIIGAGVIGLEFASMFVATGIKVTVIEQMERALPSVDADIANELIKLLKRQGVAFKFSATVKAISRQEEKLAISYQTMEKTDVVSCDKVLVAVGRKLNDEPFQSLPLEIKNGAVVVDEHMETSIEGVYAAGDIVGGQLLAHLAFAEGKIAAENALGVHRAVNYNAVPACIYTQPELATVGITEQEAKRMGISSRTGTFSFRHNGRALTLGEREGAVKVVTDQDGTILGAQILGENASELISEITLAITVKANAALLSDMIHPHPTLSEAVWEACADAVGRPIHKV